MAEGARELYRSGQISRSAYNKITGQTRSQPTKMAPFDGKGSKDEGGVRDRGDRSVASRSHIDQNQDIAPRGLKGKGTGKPSAGGSVGGSRAVPRTNAIDQGEMQRPEFPSGAKVKRQSMGGASNKRAMGRIPAQGGQYGGGGKGTQ